MLIDCQVYRPFILNLHSGVGEELGENVNELVAVYVFTGEIVKAIVDLAMFKVGVLVELAGVGVLVELTRGRDEHDNKISIMPITITT